MDKFIAHILVVDDDDGIRSLVKKYLNENKFLVTTAENAENASEKIKIIKFDLIVYVSYTHLTLPTNQEVCRSVLEV